MRFTRKKNVMPANFHLANEDKNSEHLKGLGIFITDDVKWFDIRLHI